MGGWVVCEEWADRWAEREDKGGVRESLSREVQRKITLSFTSPKKEKYFIYIYDVITWGKREKSSATQ